MKHRNRRLTGEMLWALDKTNRDVAMQLKRGYPDGTTFEEAWDRVCFTYSGLRNLGIQDDYLPSYLPIDAFDYVNMLQLIGGLADYHGIPHENDGGPMFTEQRVVAMAYVRSGPYGLLRTIERDTTQENCLNMCKLLLVLMPHCRRTGDHVLLELVRPWAYAVWEMLWDGMHDYLEAPEYDHTR